MEKTSTMKLQADNNAVTEIIAVIFLLAISIVVFASFSTMIINDTQQIQPSKETIIVATLENQQIVLQHHGGQSLEPHDTLIISLGETTTTITIQNYLEDLNLNQQWDLGEEVIYPLPSYTDDTPIKATYVNAITNTILFSGTLQQGSQIIAPISLQTSVNQPNIYYQSEPQLTLSATGDSRLNNVTLWYRYSEDNLSWGQEEYSTIGEIRKISSVGSDWTTLNYWNSYQDPVIIVTYNLPNNNDAEACVRITDVSATSCKIKIQNPGDQKTVVPGDVHILIMEKGAYNLSDGRKIEADSYLESEVASASNWGYVGTRQTYQHTYNTPVVLGSIMSTNDLSWSVTYFTDGDADNPPDSQDLYTSKHVGADSDTTRAAETIGYIVIEEGTGTINNISYKAELGSDTISGPPGGDYPLNSNYEVGVLTQGGMDGGDGSWAVLYGTDPIDNRISVACDEDTISDSERGHTSEQINYLVFSKEGNITNDILKPVGTDWQQWNGTANPDSSHPWQWTFDYPNGPGYYEFYSIGANTTTNETPPAQADAIIRYELNSTIQQITKYNQTQNTINLQATASDNYDNVTLYYRYSLDNQTWEGTPQKEKVAQLTGTTLENLDNNLNQNTLNALSFSQSSYDSDYFSHENSQDGHQITIKQDGDYLLALTIPMERTDTISTRTTLQTEIHINGQKADVGVGRSSYIRLGSYHSESSDHLHVLLENLSTGDIIEVYVKGITNEVGNDHPIIASGHFSLYLEYMENSENIFSATAEQTTAPNNPEDLNQDTAHSLKWTHTRSNSSYEHHNLNNAHQITLKDTGMYMVLVNIPLYSTSQRANIKGEILLNGIEVTGGQFQQGYIRNADNHRQSSIHWAGLINNTQSDSILTVDVQRQANSGTVTTDSEKATLFVQKINTTGLFYSSSNSLSSGTDWNPSSPTPLEWNQDFALDPTCYNHDTTTESSEITIKKPGDYLLLYNGGFESVSSLRPNNKITINVNGIPYSGAETKTNYIRNENDHTQSSACLMILLEDLSAQDIITVTTQQEANNPTVTTTCDSILILTKKSQSIEALNWTVWNDTTNPDQSAPFQWNFTYPHGDGYYEFSSVAQEDGYQEEFNGVADTRCYYKENTLLSNATSSWSCNTGLGSVLYDTKNSYNGTIQGASWTTGIEGAGLLFDGSNDYVSIDDSQNYPIGTEFSFEVWVNTTQHKTAKLLQKGDWDGHSLGQDIWGGWQANLRLSSSQTLKLEWGLGRPQLNEWYHLVMTCDGQTFIFYVNGQEQNRANITASLHTNTRPVSIASDNGNQKFFSGSMDQITIYNRALKPQEVLSNYETYS